MTNPKFRITTQDPKGRARHSLDYPNEAAATDDAQRALADMAKDHLPDGERADFKVQVEDEAGHRLYRGCLGFRGGPDEGRRTKRAKPRQA